MTDDANFSTIPKPRRMRTSTKQTMDEVSQHLYRVRVATLDQLARLMDIKSATMRAQLKRYPFITLRQPDLDVFDLERFDVGAWKHFSRTNVYTLDKDTVLFVEGNSKEGYYRGTNSNPEPNRPALNHHILMTEIYTRMYQEGLDGLEWIPGIAFHQELNRRRGDINSSYRIPILSGMKFDSKLFGCILYQKSFHGFRRLIRRLLPGVEFCNHYQLVIFILNGQLGEAHVKCANRASERYRPSGSRPKTLEENLEVGERKKWEQENPAQYVTVYDYEWAIKNPLGLIYALQGKRLELMQYIFKWHGMPSDWILRRAPVGYNCPFDWVVENADGEVIQYVDTTIGKMAGYVYQLARWDGEGTGVPRVIWVATQNEKDVFEELSEWRNIEYRIVKWEIISDRTLSEEFYEEFLPYLKKRGVEFLE